MAVVNVVQSVFLSPIEHLKLVLEALNAVASGLDLHQSRNVKKVTEGLLNLAPCRYERSCVPATKIHPVPSVAAETHSGKASFSTVCINPWPRLLAMRHVLQNIDLAI